MRYNFKKNIFLNINIDSIYIKQNTKLCLVNQNKRKKNLNA